MATAYSGWGEADNTKYFQVQQTAVNTAVFHVPKILDYTDTKPPGAHRVNTQVHGEMKGEESGSTGKRPAWSAAVERTT